MRWNFGCDFYGPDSVKFSNNYHLLFRTESAVETKLGRGALQRYFKIIGEKNCHGEIRLQRLRNKIF